MEGEAAQLGMKTVPVRLAGSLTVLVVEDQQTLAESLAVALRQQPGIGLVQVAANAADAVRLAVLDRPDVVVLDLGLPDTPGLVLCRRLQGLVPGVRVVVLTADPHAQAVAESAQLGVCAFLTKSAGLDTLMVAIRDARPHTFTVDSDLLLEMASGEGRRRETVHRLTRRELQILELMSRGSDARGIARELHVSPHTARDYVKIIYRKLDVHSQLEAVLTAFRSGELDLGA